MSSSMQGAGSSLGAISDRARQTPIVGAAQGAANVDAPPSTQTDMAPAGSLSLEAAGKEMARGLRTNRARRGGGHSPPYRAAHTPETPRSASRFCDATRAPAAQERRKAASARSFLHLGGMPPFRSTVQFGMKIVLSSLILALGIGFALPATNAYAYWCGPDRWCGPGPRVGVYAPPGVGFWWGRTWYPHRWHPGWDPGWRADPGRNYCDWHRC
jgi:hypothetical protein